MPSPYAHLIAAGILATSNRRRAHNAGHPREDTVTLLAFSLLPDLDVIPGLITGDLPAYHNQITHSLGCGLLVCLLYTFLRHLLPTDRPMKRTFGLAASAYGLHLLMDAMTWGRGVMLLWPLSTTRWQPPLYLFYGLRHSEGLFSFRHAITLVTESLTMLPLLCAVWLLARRDRPPTAKKKPAPGAQDNL